MTGIHRVFDRVKSVWQSAWPLWTLVLFASLAAVPLLPESYVRVGVAAPILLIAPGSLTLGAVFSRRHRPGGAAFICYATLLSVLWSVFASLVLYVFRVLITAGSTYGCLLIVSAVLAVVAEVRLLLGQGRGRRAAHRLEVLDPDLPDSEADDAEKSMAASGTGYYAIVAVVAGASLLAGGFYAYGHLPHPARIGYTQVAWTGPRLRGDVAIGSAGTRLPFEIVHRQLDTTTFRLSAAWLGAHPRPLAEPLTLSIGPNRTFQGSVFVPPLPDGCTYRIVVTLTAIQQIDPLTKKPPTWSINADVHDPGKSSQKCK